MQFVENVLGQKQTLVQLPTSNAWLLSEVEVPTSDSKTFCPTLVIKQHFSLL